MAADPLDSDDAARLYNAALMTHVSRIKDEERLADRTASAQAVSPICGSDVTLDLRLENGKITAIGHAVSACALTKTVLSVFKAVAIGCDQTEIAAGKQALTRLLEDGTAPQPPWQDLEILRPARDYTARHNSMLLPFEAALKIFDQLAKSP